MKVNNKDYKTLWMEENEVCFIEQNHLPFRFNIYRAKTYLDTCFAIKTMIVRGAGAIGAAAGYAMAQAAIQAPKTNYLNFINKAKAEIEQTRPTAQNLFYAVNRVYSAACISVENAVEEAENVADEDADACKKIGEFGNVLLKEGCNVLTHCNAGWLAFVDYGSALSPVYTAHRMGKKVFVYADETRPRSQGARLTAWELKNEGVPFNIIADNAAAFLMSQGKVDIVIVGADRIARNGDVANKIGTLEKAIVAKEYGIPFYVAAPLSTIDINCVTGKNIPIEYRNANEVLYQSGPDKTGLIHEILVCAPDSEAINPAFDVTPAKFITGIITEKGIVCAGELGRRHGRRHKGQGIRHNTEGRSDKLTRIQGIRQKG